MYYKQYFLANSFSRGSRGEFPSIAIFQSRFRLNRLWCVWNDLAIKYRCAYLNLKNTPKHNTRSWTVNILISNNRDNPSLLDSLLHHRLEQIEKKTNYFLQSLKKRNSRNSTAQIESNHFSWSFTRDRLNDRLRDIILDDQIDATDDEGI